jgi:sorbitol/mannitol transport system permease protein
MTRAKLTGYFLSGLTIGIALIFFIPIFWMVLTSFTTEADAFTFPPPLVFQPTLDNYRIALQQSSYFPQLANTLAITVFSTLCALLLGVPAAYSMAYYPTKRTNFTLMWVMGTRMLPSVGIIVPLYVIFKNLHLFDTHLVLIILYTALPVVVAGWVAQRQLVRGLTAGAVK